MKHRGIKIGGLLLAVSVIGGVVWYFVQPKSPINKENFDRIEIGMSREQVEDLLGGPARDESTGRLLAIISKEDKEWARTHGVSEDDFAKVRVSFRFPDDSQFAPDSQMRDLNLSVCSLVERTFFEEWLTNDRIISISFDNHGRVKKSYYLAVYCKFEGPLGMLRRLFGL